MSYEIIKEILNQDGDLTYLSKDGEGKDLVVRKFESLEEDEIDILLDRASHLQQLIHPNISQVREVLAAGEDYYLVEEIPFATNLQEYIDKKKKITMTMASWIRDSLLSALSAVHPHTIHGAIRPENVWIDMENKTAVLSCFGIFEG